MHDFKKELNDLNLKIAQILLLVIEEAKVNTAADLLKKYTTEIEEKIKAVKDAIEADNIEDIKTSQQDLKNLNSKNRQNRNITDSVNEELYVNIIDFDEVTIEDPRIE